MPLKLQEPKSENQTKGYLQKSGASKPVAAGRVAGPPMTPVKESPDTAAKSLATPKSTPIRSPDLKRARVFTSPKTLFEEEATLSACSI